MSRKFKSLPDVLNRDGRRQAWAELRELLADTSNDAEVRERIGLLAERLRVTHDRLEVYRRAVQRFNEAEASHARSKRAAAEVDLEPLKAVCDKVHEKYTKAMEERRKAVDAYQEAVAAQSSALHDQQRCERIIETLGLSFANLFGKNEGGEFPDKITHETRTALAG